LAVSGHRVVAQEAPPLPSAKEILARHVDAIGGEAAWKAVKSMRATGTFTLTAQGLSGTVEMQAGRPSNVRLNITLMGLGKIESGYDGKVGWTIDPVSGPSLLTGRELSEMADEAYFDAALHGPDYIKEFVPVGRETFSQKAAYKVKVVLKSGTEQFEFFDVATGLLLGFEGSRAMMQMGVVPTTEIIGDYKEFSGLRLPTSVTQRALGFETAITISSFEFNTVAPNAFDLPPAIKALIKRP
jgi:hypothetical protein